MLVSTDYVRPTGEGTPMFSRIGGLTSFQHRVFQEKSTANKNDKDLLPISQEFIGKNEYMPQILQQAQKQFQINQKMKKQQLIEEEKQQREREAEENGEGENTDQNDIIKSRNKGSAYNFGAISRNHSMVQRYYYGNRETPDPAHYRPNFNSVDPKNKTVIIQRGEPHLPKDKRIMKPDCIQGDIPCNIEIRKAIRMGGAIQQMPLKTEEQKSPEDEFYETERDKIQKKYNYYEQQLGLLNIPFEKYSERKKDVFLINPIPHDKRFELLKANLSVLSTRTQSVVPQIDKYAGRGELFPVLNYQPTYDPNKELLRANLKLGVPNFNRYTLRKPNDNVRPYQMPDGYDNSRLEKGISNLSEYKKPVALVDIEKQYPRDNSMYKFDQDVIKKLKKQINKKDFSFSEYLPNSIKNDYSSRNSFASTAQSVLSQHAHNKSEIISRKHSVNPIDLEKLQQVNGSFLCLDSSKKKLIDISRVQITTREFITGEKNFNSEKIFL